MRPGRQRQLVHARARQSHRGQRSRAAVAGAAAYKVKVAEFSATARAGEAATCPAALLQLSAHPAGELVLRQAADPRQAAAAAGWGFRGRLGRGEEGAAAAATPEQALHHTQTPQPRDVIRALQ